MSRIAGDPHQSSGKHGSHFHGRRPHRFPQGKKSEKTEESRLRFSTSLDERRGVAYHSVSQSEESFENRDEEKGDEPLFEDRSRLIEEVVFRLEAQAKTPATTQVVEISGDVRLPGKYPLLANRSIDSLVALAGGFENSAYLDSAEVAASTKQRSLRARTP